MKTTYYGQSTIEIETGGKKLLFDPFITHNALAKHIDINTIKPDYILVSHGHGDHVADLIEVQKNSGAKVILPPSATPDTVIPSRRFFTSPAFCWASMSLSNMIFRIK